MDSLKDIPLWDFRFPHKDAIPLEIIRVEMPPKRVDFSRPNRVDSPPLSVDSKGGTTVNKRNHPPNRTCQRIERLNNKQSCRVTVVQYQSALITKSTW